MKYRSNDVLVVVPLTDEGKIVLKQAIYFQKIISFRIFVLNVIPPISFINRHFNSQKVEELKKDALKKLTNFVKDFFGGEIPEKIILKVSMGNLVPTLIKHTQSDDFLFVVLKRSIHQKGISNLLDQSEMDKVIAHSQCPVLSVNEESTSGELKTILVPVDISESTKKRLLWASMFAKKANAKILIVSALNANIDVQKSLALKNAERIQSMLSERGIQSDLEILKVGDQLIHEMVLSFIAENKPDLIIIRKHHIVSFFSNTIGDFAKEIIHGSKIPVFTVSQRQKDIANRLA